MWAFLVCDCRCCGDTLDSARKLPHLLFVLWLQKEKIMSVFESPKSESQAKALFSIASDAISELISVSGKLDRKGICEAIMFNSNLILNHPNLNLKHNSENIQNDYLVLLLFLIKKEKPQKSTEELVSFINERLDFYFDEYNKLISENRYSPMWVYSTFYLAPLEEEPKPCIDAFKIMSFQIGLIAMVKKVNELLSFEDKKI